MRVHAHRMCTKLQEEEKMPGNKLDEESKEKRKSIQPIKIRL